MYQFKGDSYFWMEKVAYIHNTLGVHFMSLQVYVVKWDVARVNLVNWLGLWVIYGEMELEVELA